MELKEKVEHFLVSNFHEFGVLIETWSSDTCVVVSVPKGTTDTRPNVDALGAEKLSKKIKTAIEMAELPVDIEFVVRDIIWSTADAVYAEKEIVRSI